MSVIHEIVDVEVLPPHALRVVFEDGEVRQLDLSDQLDGPVFAPLRDPAEFARVKVDPETGTVTWPSGADLDPIVVYRGVPPVNAVKAEAAGRA